MMTSSLGCPLTSKPDRFYLVTLRGGRVGEVIKRYPTRQQCETWALMNGLVYEGGGHRWLDSDYLILEGPECHLPA